MSGLSLSYCQLIKIVLSQIGGSPLKQVYTQLSQGAQQITAGSGVIPNPLTEVKAVIDQITNAINTVSGAVGSAQDMMEKIGQQIYQNPMGAPIAAAKDMAETKVTKITIRQQDIVAYENAHGADTATPQYPYTSIVTEKQRLTDEKAQLLIYIDKLDTYLANTNRLSGVATLSGSEAGGGCSLQDLLGSGCTPNDAVPDIDLKNLIDSLKQGDLLLALKDRMYNAAGFNDYEQALADLNSRINSFVDSFNNLVNKAAIRNAVQAQITQIVYNLLSGCSGGIYDLTLKSNVANTISSYVSVLQDEADGKAYVDPNGNVQPILTVTTTPSTIVNVDTAAPRYTAGVIVYAPEKEQKGYDLGTNYASGEEALLAMDAILEKNGKTKYTITIFKDNVKVASSSKNM
jgi:hypothetical protein